MTISSVDGRQYAWRGTDGGPPILRKAKQPINLLVEPGAGNFSQATNDLQILGVMYE
jgi:hypothetical protein